MKLARVVKKVVSPVKNRAYHQRPLLLVQPLTGRLAARGPEVVAVDFMHADIGEIVLLMEEGSSCQQMLADKGAPVDAAVVAIVDEVDLGGEKVYRKSAPAAP